MREVLAEGSTVAAAAERSVKLNSPG
jgi:hypothetical protein